MPKDLEAQGVWLERGVGVDHTVVLQPTGLSVREGESLTIVGPSGMREIVVPGLCRTTAPEHITRRCIDDRAGLADDRGMSFRIQEARWQSRVDRMFFGAALIDVIGF